MQSLLVAGIGMVPFHLPHGVRDGRKRAAVAIRRALLDADLEAALVDQVVIAQTCGEPADVEELLSTSGLEGRPTSLVGNGDASGSKAMLHARQSILAGDSECALVVGFEQGGASRAAAAPGRIPTRLGEAVLAELVAQSRRHAACNSDAVRRRALSSTQLLSVPASRRDRLFTAPLSCGAAAAIICSSRFGARLALRGDVAVVAQAAGCDLHGFDADHGGLGRTAGIAYRRAGIGPAEVHVVELHDACAAAKAHACAALGLCTIDALPEFVRCGGGTYGGKVVVGPSGGMLANGVAPNSGGLAQLVELTRQLRGEAGPRQVAGARVGLQHNVASSKEVVITVLQRV